MSATAIKSFFAHAKEASKRKRVYKKKIEETPEPEYIVDTEKLEDAYNFIKNWNNILKEDDSYLISYFESLDDDSYEYVLSKKDDFSDEVKNILWPEELITPKCGTRSTFKARELTEEEYNQMIIKKISDRENEIKEIISAIEIPSRSAGPLDSQLDRLQKSIPVREKELEELKDSLIKTVGNGKYMPAPRKKELVDQSPEVIRMIREIEDAKNEIAKIEIKIKQLENDWKKYQHTILRNRIEQELIMSGV